MQQVEALQQKLQRVAKDMGDDIDRIKHKATDTTYSDFGTTLELLQNIHDKLDRCSFLVADRSVKDFLEEARDDMLDFLPGTPFMLRWFAVHAKVGVEVTVNGCREIKRAILDKEHTLNSLAPNLSIKWAPKAKFEQEIQAGIENNTVYFCGDWDDCVDTTMVPMMVYLIFRVSDASDVRSRYHLL